MRHLAKVSFSLVVAASLAISMLAVPRKDYFTEDELDMIRDAQDLSARVPTYFKLAEHRLVYLGVMEKSAPDKENEKKAREKRQKEQRKTTDSRASADKAPLDDMSYLEDFTPTELIRGYIQVLDEVTTNIDDAYSRKLDVRDALEDLDKFIRQTSPLLEKYKPQNQSERAALEDAAEKARKTAADTKEALNIVPKTEKKRKP